MIMREGKNDLEEENWALNTCRNELVIQKNSANLSFSV